MELPAQSTATLDTLVEFDNTNGSAPNGLFLGSDGTFYGMTAQGGTNFGAGTLFQLTTNGILATLFTFSGTNGSTLTGNLVPGNHGDLYGTASQGGLNGFGTVFKLAADGTLTTLVTFNGTNGAIPFGNLTLGADLAYYGTTAGGGTNSGMFQNGAGTIFRLTTNRDFTSVFSFSNINGNQPVGGLTLGGDGNFYGTTYGGGATFTRSSAGSGTVFRFTPDGTLTTLVSFNSTNGTGPQATMVLGRDGALYGTTTRGGTNGDNGTVFKVTTDGTLTTLVSFNGTNGSLPFGGLIQGSDGAFYGMTAEGGTGDSGNGMGTIYRLTAAGAFTTLFDFNGTNGSSPEGDLVQGSDGAFYGATSEGGTNSDGGTVFRLSYPPAAAPLIAGAVQAGSALGLSWIPLPERNYQVQYKTNLTQTNWTNLGGPITASNSVVTTSDLLAPGSAQRYYQVVLLP